ncbi:MAG TPA: DegT/DnrJ/EryC1/StrS aminotransferase family protein [Gemmatimonadaceae bacterium]|nr:DegT/DnrJ/EryC1/StrS aminotransferase family protein [Gemmatimonadaceae bacterium]
MSGLEAQPGVEAAVGTTVGLRLDPAAHARRSAAPLADVLTGDPVTAPTRPRRETFLSFAAPCIGEEEIAEVVDTLRSDWITIGPKTHQFEAEFAAFLGAPGALALNSCTAGLHTALVTLGIGEGDEVITTPMTFAASVNVIEHVRARPVLVDIEADTLNIDASKIEAAITPRTRAIIAVHYAGQPVDLRTIRALADAYGLRLIEDAAHALPARFEGEPIGASGSPVAFSFYATKNLTTAEGGMLTGDPDFLARARVVSLHGLSRDAWRRYQRGGSWYYEIEQPGFKYNMTDVQAAIGIWQLRKLERAQQRRREVVAAYSRAFADHPALELPVVRPGREHAWHLYTLRLRLEALTIDRDRFIQELTERNIGNSVHFIPIHLHPYYREKYGYRPESLPVAYDSYRRMLSLPLSAGLTDADVDDVVDAVLDIARRHAR